MKKKIHPTYYKNARITCACGKIHLLGATKEHIEIEVCSGCHPFYTGDDRGKMRGGQVEKFRERMAKKATAQKKAKTNA